MAETSTDLLGLIQPAEDDAAWKDKVDPWADKIDEIARQYIPFYIAGEAVDEEIILNGFKFNHDVDISGVSMFARSGPTGSALQLDFLKDDAEQSKLVTINAGSVHSFSAVTGLEYLQTPSVEELGLKIKNVGSTNPGAEIWGLIHYNVKPIPTP
ncbi:MAG: hypothetical protein G3M70_07335 [Candidatus Nitronauta litoralis]|uniref:Uncharacterized protein n=1 Tax=Candidatus Nitronauta litoralis TaxID=2705533 RepID=A0A7T0BVI9_9BACT|nr:MAG: hypothetical protein G3M70_07335 [Candidatus Nitronauta litoralis]